jgi:branched-chain amino acid aminotransferase
MAWDTPPSLWMNGKLVPWNDCRVHVTSAYAQRGASIFEGIRVYRTNSRKYLALAFSEHLGRLKASWDTFRLPTSLPNSVIKPALLDLLNQREVGDSYCRVTRFLDVPDIETKIETDGLMVALYQSEQLLGRPVSCITSSWRRNEFAVPAQTKIGGHYFMLSWVRQQAKLFGADDAILLNQNDYVAEATGTAIFISSNGRLVTPPITDGALPSITVRTIGKLAARVGLPITVRSIHRSELSGVEAAFLAGTLDELRPITSIDGVKLPNALDCKPVAKIFAEFSKICRSEAEQTWGELIEL